MIATTAYFTKTQKESSGGWQMVKNGRARRPQ